MRLEFNSLDEVREFAKVLFQVKPAEVKVEAGQQPDTKKEVAPKAAEEKPVKEEPEEVPQYTQEQVRAKLTELSRAGKAKAVKQLLTDAGATNVTSLDPSKYAEVMQKAGDL